MQMVVSIVAKRSHSIRVYGFTDMIAYIKLDFVAELLS